MCKNLYSYNSLDGKESYCDIKNLSEFIGAAVERSDLNFSIEFTENLERMHIFMYKKGNHHEDFPIINRKPIKKILDGDLVLIDKEEVMFYINNLDKIIVKINFYLDLYLNNLDKVSMYSRLSNLLKDEIEKFELEHTL